MRLRDFHGKLAHRHSGEFAMSVNGAKLRGRRVCHLKIPRILDTTHRWSNRRPSRLATESLFQKYGASRDNDKNFDNEASRLAAKIDNFATLIILIIHENPKFSFLEQNHRRRGDSLWYDVTNEKSRIVLFIILRSQKWLTITIGKIMDFSLERFANLRFLRHKF